MKPKSSKTKTVSLWWCGRRSDGTLVWFAPEHCSGHNEAPHPKLENDRGGTMFRVRITVEQVFDKRGRAIEGVVK